MNLVLNSRDAMPNGGTLTIETRDVELDAESPPAQLDAPAGAYVMLAVSDTGVGMDAATLGRVFEPFFTTKEAGKGTGLGLSTVFGIVKQSGGSLWAESELGRGTAFRVYLPKAAYRVPTLETPVGGRPTLGGTETVLLVEDDEQVRHLARAVLAAHGYRVLEAASGGDALVISEQFQGDIDVLLTDVVMPRMNGRQLAERVLESRPATRVLFMSGCMDDSIVRRGVSSSDLAFIQKPFLPHTLLAKLRDVLDTAAALP